VLLQDRLEILLMGVGGDGLDLWSHRAKDVFFHVVETAIEIDRGDNGFVDGGGKRAGHFVAAADAFADDEQFSQAGFVGDLGAGTAVNDCRFDFGKVALEIFREAFIEGFANDQIKDCVAEELHSLIALEPVVRDGGVGESLFQQMRVLKRVREQFLRTFPSFCIHKCTGKTINDGVKSVNLNWIAECRLPNCEWGEFFIVFGAGQRLRWGWMRSRIGRNRLVSYSRI
jgi:hypothetical protein